MSSPHPKAQTRRKTHGLNLHPSEVGRRQGAPESRLSSRGRDGRAAPQSQSQLRETRSIADKGEKVTDATPEALRGADCKLIQGRVPPSGRWLGFQQASRGPGVPRASARRPPGASSPARRAAPERPRAARPGQPITHSGGHDGERERVTYPAATCQRERRKRRRRQRRQRRRQRQRQASLAGLMRELSRDQKRWSCLLRASRGRWEAT
ncbi:uncharacterized protein Gm30447 [Mus musculus]|uniref:uncharacterized protein Gm30447 n=1 Tax=Mus musculus TaxID=10090 RepID=UPI0003D7086E|nr:uncharacterized protein Gm30447 [Mus musculus]|eukprot:XP_006511663.1 PREDICTED: uncharacterized protein Gm30447 [Mus musculus]